MATSQMTRIAGLSLLCWAAGTALLPAQEPPSAEEIAAIAAEKPAPVPQLFRGKERLPWEKVLAGMVQRWNIPPRPEPTPTTQHEHKLEQRSMQVPSKMPRLPTIEMHVQVPVDARGKPLPSAHDVVYFAPHLASKKPLEREFLKQLSTRYGMTVLSFVWKTSLKQLDDRKACYYYPESGSFDVVFEGLKLLRQEFGLEERKFWLLGESGGGSMAARMGVLHEDKIVAVGLVGATRLDAISQPNSLPWLIINTRGDSRTEMNQQLAWGLQHHGASVLLAQTQPSWGLRVKNAMLYRHVAKPWALEMLQQFVIATRDLRDQHNGSVPTCAQWPLEDRDHEGHPVRLPSERLAQLWADQVPAMQRVELTVDNKSMGTAFVTLPRVSSKGLLVRHNAFGGEGGSLIDLADDLYYTAHRWDCIGIAVSPARGVSSDAAADAAIRIVRERLLAHGAKVDFPIVVTAYGSQAAHLDAFRSDIGKSLHLTLINPQGTPDWLTPEQVRLLVKDEEPPKGVPAWKETEFTRKITPVPLQSLSKEERVKGAYCTYLDLAVNTIAPTASQPEEAQSQ